MKDQKLPAHLVIEQLLREQVTQAGQKMRVGEFRVASYLLYCAASLISQLDKMELPTDDLDYSTRLNALIQKFEGLVRQYKSINELDRNMRALLGEDWAESRIQRLLNTLSPK